MQLCGMPVLSFRKRKQWARGCVSEIITTFHGFTNLLSSRLLSNDIKIRIYKTIILPVVLYGCETWSLTLREEHRQIVFEQGAEENIWAEERRSDGRFEEIA
jgi:hypothetical protein